MSRFVLSAALAFVLGVSSIAQAADLPSPMSPSPSLSSSAFASAPLYDPSKFEVRGGYMYAPFGNEVGSSDVTAALVFPKFFRLPGWQDMLVPRLRVGGVANLSGQTSYLYADGLWTANYDRVFVEIFFGGLVHNGPLTNYVSNTASALGCRELYHLGADVGYRIDPHWSVIASFEHGSNGEPVLSNCPQNRGLNVMGLGLGYSF